MENENQPKQDSGLSSRPLNCSTRRGYERPLCSRCGEGLGFSESDPCDNCFLVADADAQDYESSDEFDFTKKRRTAEMTWGETATRT